MHRAEGDFAIVFRIARWYVVDGLLLIVQIGLGIFHPVVDDGGLLTKDKSSIDALDLI